MLGIATLCRVFEEWEKNHGTYDLSSDSSSDSGEESDKDKEKGMLIARLVYAFHFTAGNKNVYPHGTYM